jgi:hypothetical protein
MRTTNYFAKEFATNVPINIMREIEQLARKGKREDISK